MGINIKKYSSLALLFFIITISTYLVRYFIDVNFYRKVLSNTRWVKLNYLSFNIV